MNTKSIFPALFFICFSLSLLGQNNETNQTVQQNWRYYHDQGAYEQAAEQAKLIYQLGERTDNKELMAQALNWEAQSLTKLERRASVNRKRAIRLLEESLQLLISVDNKNLRLDNLQRLRDLALQEKDTQAYAAYDQQIKTIENEIAANRSNQALSEQVMALGSEKTQLQNKVASLSAAQMRAELLIAMQKNYLDSMKMSRMKDSFQLVTKEILLREQATQLELQNNQIQLQNSQRNFFIAVAVILLTLAVGAYIRSSEIKKYNVALNAKNEALSAEQERSERLLLNILPSMVAEELKDHGVTKARRYELATVMFIDFKEFSKIAKLLRPEELVAELDTYFKAFDKIINKYKIEKIKTIGDAYMCVGGLPDVEGSEPKDVVLAALEIQDLMDQFKSERERINKPFFEARIGIHTGPLVAGVVGSMKFAYDIWGDTVNIASRLESNGQPWRVNISAVTYELVKDDFEFETRGIIPIKNNNEIGMYFVNPPLRKAMAIV